MDNTYFSQKNPHLALISIGSNMGNRLGYIETSILEIEKIPTRIVKKSHVLETKALEVINQPDFLNCILLIETDLSPVKLLDALQNIETKIGRVKRFDKGPREIDLDILTFGDLVVDNERLTLPHHSIESRPFIKELLTGLQWYLDTFNQY